MSGVPSHHDLASDSGPLVSIHARRESVGRYNALALVFSKGVMTVRCDVETDEVVVTVDAEAPGDMPSVERDVDDGLCGLEGMVIEYVWMMINHRGYSDALQIRLLNLDSREEQARQFEVAASAMTIHRVIV